jgi:hypothetical protein
LDLPTHLAFGLAIGLVFYGKTEAALLIGFGALIPDLDREYWFVRRKDYRDEQPHRARLHNVFLMALAYILSPFLALGIFLHAFLDSFTTVKDRGVELFWPLTRFVKGGWKSGDRSVNADHPVDEHIFYWQEDVKGYLEDADPDVWKPGDKPVPWRRVYGFALNSRILDKWFLLGSIAVILTWLFVPNSTNASLLVSYLYSKADYWLAGFGGIVLIYISGDLDRRWRPPLERRLSIRKVSRSYKYPLILICLVGMVILCYWIYLSASAIVLNLTALYSIMMPLFVAIALVSVAGLISILLDIKNDPVGIV